MSSNEEHLGKLLELVDMLPEHPQILPSPTSKSTDYGADLRMFLLGEVSNRQDVCFNYNKGPQPYGQLSMRAAIMCLSDTTRTKRFLTAARLHMEALLAGTTGELLVIDAGCGPTPIFAILCALMSERVKAICLESNPSSEEVAKAVVERFGLASRIKIIQADAQTWHAPAPIDLLVSETLHTGFVEEAFTEIMYNLVRQLSPHGRTVPELVEVQWAVTCTDEAFRSGMWVHFPAFQPRPLIEDIKYKTEVVWTAGMKLDRIEIPVGIVQPPRPDQARFLALTSRLGLYGNATPGEPVNLEANESLLTMPYLLTLPNVGCDGKSFWYMSYLPGKVQAETTKWRRELAPSAEGE